MKVEPGTILEGLYEVIESFGGGMGVVHRARHRIWNIEVAIKHPKEKCMLDPEGLEMFYSECATWADIGLHPYVVTCFYAREIDGIPCVVAEFVPEGSLRDAIVSKSLYKGEEDQCLARMLTIAASSAWGLSSAHAARLIHCDVKPENMLLTKFGTAKIADFGLAIGFIGPDGSSRQSWMTEEYAAPEQLRRESLTPAVDTWGWAASMLVMFTGVLSWESGAACGAVLEEFIKSGGKAYRIPPIPEAFAALLGECFRFDPDERISDFGQIAGRICQCYEELFGELCPSNKPDLELISADSLNNRAVSKHDVNLTAEVQRLPSEALTNDPLHPEANFNCGWLIFLATGGVPEWALKNLETAARYDLGQYRPHLYRACLLNINGQADAGLLAFDRAVQLSGDQESAEIHRLWNLSGRGNLHLILSPPISGEAYGNHMARFERLMRKSEAAIADKHYEDANRYLMMSGDIPGFGRHPRRLRILERMNSTPQSN